MPIEFATAPVLKSKRLTLRRWRPGDAEPFERMCADSHVMQYFHATLTQEETRAYISELQIRFRRWGFGYWAVETADEPFIGFIGLSRPSFDAHFTPTVEIGWRLAKHVWGRGFATEGALIVLDYAFDELNLDEVVSMASLANAASLRVMEKIGMTRDAADDFDHPGLADSPHLKRCALYRKSRLVR
jgi:RimJ/RimL family protein N-acetyltransferase